MNMALIITYYTYVAFDSFHCFITFDALLLLFLLLRLYCSLAVKPSLQLKVPNRMNSYHIRISHSKLSEKILQHNKSKSHHKPQYEQMRMQWQTSMMTLHRFLPHYCLYWFQSGFHVCLLVLGFLFFSLEFSLFVLARSSSILTLDILQEEQTSCKTISTTESVKLHEQLPFQNFAQ
jgi:hypothetical protein